ncbi:hypothetical protein OHC33_009873 [Knufia fluminis]|uniref:Nab2-like CCCH zinc finger domain-containing protein n=1 Tax=Knufia fluminis TaxID=191047 RepID=A0AAN8III1_9EURO|nr:hypothetical protein OHC33_009873 [Knufia fluminis]
MASIAEESPLAEQLKNAVQAKAIEYSWTQDEDDTSLAEYIVLMVANGKNQEQIAAELSGELLQDAEGTEDFAQWLTNYVAKLTGAAGNDESVPAPSAQEDAPIPAAYDNDLGESAPDNAPRGPKGLHGGPRGGRGGRNSIPGRGGFDSALHRTRGSDRINSHTRGAPKGPKSLSKDTRPGMQKALNGPQAQQMQNAMMQGAQNGQFNPISPSQQMEFMAMMEQQARMLAQFMPNMVPPGMNGGPPQNGQNGQNGRSMFDRVERGRGGARGGRGRGANSQTTSRKPSEAVEGENQMPTDTAMEGAESTSNAGPKDPSSTICYFNLRCLNKECQYAHQSPAAPVGTEVDMSSTCSFGAACKNTACHGKHPSPALIAAHKAEQECKFFPNCTNPNCSFKHPTMPLCQFGASCNNKECKFTHLKTKCKFNPCTNSRCPFQHEPGQNRNMAAFTWTKDQAMNEQPQEEGPENENGNENHVSNRRFVVEGDEELIKGEGDNQEAVGEIKPEDVVT